jgi:hypothetical protein
MSAAKFVTITTDDKYFIPEACMYLIQYYLIKIVSALRQVVGFLQFPSRNKTDRHDLTEILLKVALSTIAYLRFVYKCVGSSRFTNIGGGYGYGA